MKRLITKWLGVALLCVLSAAPASAATYYVSASGGNDGRSCATAQTIGTPKATVNSGIGCLSAGDTLLVRSGTYAENVTSVPNGTSWTNKVRIAAYPGETVWLTPSSPNTGYSVLWLDGDFHYVEFDGINMDGRPSQQNNVWISTNNSNNPHHIRVQNAEMISGEGIPLARAAVALGGHVTIGQTGANEMINLVVHGGGTAGLCGFACASYGFYLAGPSNLVERCDIYNTSGAGVQIYNASGDPADNNIVRSNRIHDITRTGSLDEVWGIIVVGSTNQVYNNLIYGINVGNVNPGNAGIAVAKNSNAVWNNTIYGNSNSGIRLDSTAVSTEVKNNVAYANGGSQYSDGGATGTVTATNLFGVNPIFMNAGAGDFHLQTTSPAKNAGTTIAQVTTDFEGTTRPQGGSYDIGAYEYQPSAAPSAPTGLRIVE